MHPPPLNRPIKTAICCSFLREAGIFSSLKTKREDICYKRRKLKGYSPPPSSSFLKALCNQAWMKVQGTGTMLLLTGAPPCAQKEGWWEQSKLGTQPGWTCLFNFFQQCHHFTNCQEENDLLSVAGGQCRGTLSWGLVVPTRSLAHCEHSGSGGRGSLSSKLF